MTKSSPAYDDRRNRARHLYPLLCEGAAKPEPKPSIRSMIKTAKKAGAKVTVAADGSVTLQFGETKKNEAKSDLDRELEEFEARHG
jgi:hypothetical protein